MEHLHIIDLHDKLCDLMTTLQDVGSRLEEMSEALTAIDEGERLGGLLRHYYRVAA